MGTIGQRVGAVCGSVDNGIEFFGYGVYVGDEEMPVGAPGVFGPAQQGDPPNPKIVLDSGEVVWGCQCWWGPEEKVKKNLEGQNVILVTVAEKLNKG